MIVFVEISKLRDLYLIRDQNFVVILLKKLFKKGQSTAFISEKSFYLLLII